MGAPRRRSDRQGEREALNRTTAQLKLFVDIWAVILTPLVIIAGYFTAGTLAAIQFRITDVDADLIEGLVVAMALLVSIQLWPIPSQHRRALTMLWLIRIGVALGVMLLYEAYYNLDASLYYLLGTYINDPASWLAYGEGTNNVIALVGYLSELTTSYSALKLIFSYIGLVSVYVFYRAAVLALEREVPALLYILGIFPSLLFWSSILGKDPITLLGVAIFCYGVAGMIGSRNLLMLFYIALGLAISASIRIWLGAVFLAPLLLAVILGGRISSAMKAGFVMLAVPLFLLTVQGFAEQFSLETASDLVARTDSISQSWAHGGSAQVIEGGFNSIGEMLLFMPVGAFAALFRPLPGEILNPFGIMAGLENALLLGLIINGLMRRGLAWIGQPILLWAALTLGAWAAIYGFASYQNLGTAFRFRVQVVPILLMLGLYLSFFSAAGLPRLKQRFLVSGLSREPAGEGAGTDA
jgi:hypothetical protein